MKEIWTLAKKDIRLLLRDKAGFFFTFFFPLLIAVFFGTIFSGGGGGSSSLPVIVVDEDQSPGSREFITVLQAAEELEIELSQREPALTRVRQGKATAFIALKPGFGEAMERVFYGDPPRIEIGVDPARKAEAAMLQGILTKYAVQNFQKIFSDPDLMRGNIKKAQAAVLLDQDSASQEQPLLRFLGELDTFLGTPQAGEAGESSGFQPLAVDQVDVVVHREGPRNAYVVSFPQGMIWGIIGCAAAFGISIVTERRTGTLVRLQLAPISRTHILAGKALACFITTNGLAVGMFLIGYLVFGIEPNSILLLALAFFSTSFAFVGIMMLLSVIGKTERSAGGIGWAIMMVMSMLGGGMIPLFFMPTWLRNISHFSPVKWAILVIEGAIWRDFSLMEMVVPCLILMAVGVVFFSLGVRLFRWSVQN